MGPNKSTRPDNSIDAYRKFKLKILKRDFCINITNEEKAHAESLKTEVQIDQFFLGMINKYWN
jgi:hypothetical protein